LSFGVSREENDGMEEYIPILEKELFFKEQNKNVVWLKRLFKQWDVQAKMIMPFDSEFFFGVSFQLEMINHQEVEVSYIQFFTDLFRCLKRGALQFYGDHFDSCRRGEVRLSRILECMHE
jgi:hypothetical protein